MAESNPLRRPGMAISLLAACCGAGGGAGKFVCGVPASRAGVLRTVILTGGRHSPRYRRAAAVAGGGSIFSAARLSAWRSTYVFSALWDCGGTGRRWSSARAFAIFYTCTIGAGAVSPWFYDRVSDGIGLTATLALISVAVLLVVPLSLPLYPALQQLGHR